MDAVYSECLTVAPSLCDHTARLGIASVFSLFMDIATAHAELLGVGAGQLLSRGLFWLTVRSKARLYRRPAMNERVTLTTWPEAPQRLRCNRCYRLSAGEELLAEGKTEWAVLDRRTNALTSPEGVFPAGLDYPDDSALPEPFLRIRDAFDGDPFYDYSVRSTDIDLGGHMNNVAYLRALLGGFTTQELDAWDPHELEFAYRSPCYEGDRLFFWRQEGEEGTRIRAAAEDGRTVLLGNIR